MFQSAENYESFADSCDAPKSDSSETPSELEARLYSVLHYHDLTQPLPPEITSQYSIDISGTDVCISVNKDSSIHRNMTESCTIEAEGMSPGHQKSDGSNFINRTLTKSNDTESINEEVEASSKNNLQEELDEGALSAYISYLAWTRYPSRSLVDFIASNLPGPDTDSNSCKKLVQKYAEPIIDIKKRMKRETLPAKLLKKIFFQFVIEACVPKDAKVSEAVSEFASLLSSVDATFFRGCFANLLPEPYSIICSKFSIKKVLVRKVLLHKFQVFIDENISKGEWFNKEDCVEQFCAELSCGFSESVLLNNTTFKEQLYDVYENDKTVQGKRTCVEKEKLRCSKNAEDSRNDSFDDTAPMKKRKLNNGKEQVSYEKASIKNSDEENELHKLLLKHNPYMNKKDVLLRIFSQFHAFSMKEKFKSDSVMRKHKFTKVFAKYRSSVNCFNTLYCDLIDETLFRELFVFGINYWNKHNLSDAKAISEMIETLAEKALLSNLPGKPEVLDKKTGVKEPLPSMSNVDSCIDVIVLSDDDGDVITVGSGSKISQNSTSTSSQENIWINSSNSPSCSSQDQQPFTHRTSVSQKHSSAQSSDLSKLQVCGYTMNCPRSWSKEMVNYYCRSWGGETFDHVPLLRKLRATTKPSDWKVNNFKDLIPSRKRKRSHEHCKRCLEWGHLESQCKMPIKPVVCSICGEFNHLFPACTNKKCLRCGVRRHRFSDSCENCVKPSNNDSEPRCVFCESNNHEYTSCPDTWRSYHLTVEGEVVIPPELQMNPRQYCCNCGEAGHIDYFCPLLIKRKKRIANNPFVLNYNVEKQYVEQCNVRGDSYSDKHKKVNKKATLNPDANCTKSGQTIVGSALKASSVVSLKTSRKKKHK